MILLIVALTYLVGVVVVFFSYFILDCRKHGSRPDWHDTKWYMVLSVLWPLLPLGRLLKNLK